MQNLETEINDISLIHVKGIGEAEEVANLTWGGLKGNLIIGQGKDLYICDGIDPTTGKPISQEILDQFKLQYDLVMVHV